MRLDPYIRVVLGVIAVALAVIALNPWLTAPTRSAEAQTATAKYELSIPRAWGKILAFANQNLLLEAADGTLRVVDLEGKPPEYPRVKVQAKWQ